MFGKFGHLKVDKNKPVVFLDLCGTVNHVLAYRPWFAGNAEMIIDGDDWADAHIMKLLVGILNNSGSQVIFVTSWVASYKPSDDARILSIANKLGLSNVLGSVFTGGGTGRGQSVSNCVSELGLEKYLIIDDASPMYEDNPELHGNIVYPDGRWGLTYQQLDEIYITLKRLLRQSLTDCERFTERRRDKEV